MKFETKAIHAGQKPDPVTGAVVTPIVTATTFAQPAPGKPLDYEYSRVSTPTRRAVEVCLTELEGGIFALALSSGCAAMNLLCHFLKPGDVVLAEEDLYGGTLRLLKHLEKIQNIQVHFLDFSNLPLVKEKLTLNPRILWLETPTNPLLKVLDIKKVQNLGQSIKNCLIIVDNTFATPCFQSPLALGADFVFHSATKYLGGHTDILGGVIVTKREDLAEKLRFLNKTLGPVLSPFDSYLLLRSLKTLSLRMKAHEQNALQVAEFLESHSQVQRVIYPGLKTHPQFSLAKNQMSGFSGMVSFYIKGGEKKAMEFLKRLKIFTLAESLGAVESLAEHPLSMTHKAFSSKGVTEELIRLSVGIEHIEDVIEDLKQALEK